MSPQLIRFKTQCELLEGELKSVTEKLRQVESELHENRMEVMRSNQHWMTLEMLFKGSMKSDGHLVKVEQAKSLSDVGIQVDIAVPTSPEKKPVDVVPPSPAPRKELKRTLTYDKLDVESPAQNKCLESQLKQAMSLASTRSALLLETENRLAEAQGRVIALERCLEERERVIKEQQNQRDGQELEKRDENILSVRI